MSDEVVIAAQRNAYRANFLEHGDSPLGTYQNNQTTQYLRFERLLRNLVPEAGSRATLHDVGSGLCDLYQFISGKGLDVILDYSGTEIVEEMNAAARLKFPRLTLLNRNLLLPSDDRYDFVVASGTFNLLGGIPESEWRTTCYRLIEAMYARAKRAIAFNFLTSYRTFSDPSLCYFDPREMFDFATTRLSRFVELDASYPLYECTLVAFRPDYVASRNDHPHLAKYFR